MDTKEFNQLCFFRSASNFFDFNSVHHMFNLCAIIYFLIFIVAKSMNGAARGNWVDPIK